MKKHWQYLKYVVRHKWYVFVECRKLGIAWRGVTHDLSKLLPSEWFPYVKYFYGSPPYTNDLAFDLAWLKHQKRNKHHWQYWVLREDDGGEKIFEMPDKYRREMLADWHGAGKAIHGASANTRMWYTKNRITMMLHKETRAWLETQLGVVDG